MQGSLSRQHLQICTFTEMPQRKVGEYFYRSQQVEYGQHTKIPAHHLRTRSNSSRPPSLHRDFTRQDSCCVLGQYHSTIISGQGSGYTFDNVQYRSLKKILERTEENIIKILTQFIKQISNVLTNCLSRHNQIISTEWTFHQDICSLLWRLWGCPSMDLFATRLNFRLPKFYRFGFAL